VDVVGVGNARTEVEELPNADFACEVPDSSAEEAPVGPHPYPRLLDPTG
jgi:hypothetical protein